MPQWCLRDILHINHYQIMITVRCWTPSRNRLFLSTLPHDVLHASGYVVVCLSWMSNQDEIEVNNMSCIMRNWKEYEHAHAYTGALPPLKLRPFDGVNKCLIVCALYADTVVVTVHDLFLLLLLLLISLSHLFLRALLLHGNKRDGLETSTQCWEWSQFSLYIFLKIHSMLTEVEKSLWKINVSLLSVTGMVPAILWQLLLRQVYYLQHGFTLARSWWSTMLGGHCCFDHRWENKSGHSGD